MIVTLKNGTTARLQLRWNGNDSGNGKGTCNDGDSRKIQLLGSYVNLVLWGAIDENGCDDDNGSNCINNNFLIPSKSSRGTIFDIQYYFISY